MAKQITTQELKAKIDGGKKDFFLIDVLLPNSFEAHHVPGAKNVPYGSDFASRFEKEAGAPKDAEIIVYCASTGCQLSHLAAADLEKAGYGNVWHYAEGLAGWQDAGYEFARGLF